MTIPPGFSESSDFSAPLDASTEGTATPPVSPSDDAPNDTPPHTGAAPDSPAADPLSQAVAEVEEYIHRDGWNTSRQIFALVRTTELLAHEPGLIGQLGQSDDAEGGSDPDGANPTASLPEFTPVQQGELPGDTVAAALSKIAWPDEIAGCILVLEIAAEKGDKTAEGRLAVGVMRNTPSGACALRWRHAPDGPVSYHPDLAPDLIKALHATFEP